MGFNRRKIEADRKAKADAAAAARRATNAQVSEDAERLIAAWNERQAPRMPLLFPPTIGAALAARYWFIWLRCPACRTIKAVDLRTLDRLRDAGVTSLIPALVLQVLPTERAVCGARPAVADQPRRRNAGRISPSHSR